MADRASSSNGEDRTWELRFGYQADDAGAFLDSTDRGSVRTSWYVVALVVVMLVGPLAVFQLWEGNWRIAAAAAGFLGIGIPLATYVFGWLTARELGASLVGIGELRIRITPDGIESAGDAGWGNYGWRWIVEVDEYGSFLRILTENSDWAAPSRLYILIPHRAFADAAARQACLADCRRYLSLARQDADSRPPPAELRPARIAEALQGEHLRFDYQHQASDERRFSDLGIEWTKPTWLWMTILVVTVVAHFVGSLLLWKYFPQLVNAVERGGYLLLLIASFSLPLHVLQNGIRHLEPATTFNSPITFTISPLGIHVVARDQEAFGSLWTFRSLEERGEFLLLMLRGSHVERTIPIVAIAATTSVARLQAMFAELTPEPVDAEVALRVPPSDNPYRPPETK